MIDFLGPFPFGREQAWSPRRLPGLCAWFDASDVATLSQNSDGTGAIGANGQTVGFWRDKGPAGHALVQVLVANRPTWRTAQFGPMPALDFDGSNDYYQPTGLLLPQPNTVFAVVDCDSPAGAFVTFFDGAVSTGRHILRYASGQYTMGAPSLLAGGTTDASAHIIGATFNGTSSSLRVDGVAVATGNAGSQALDGMTVGATYTTSSGFDGRIGEILVVNGPLALPEIERVEAYLRRKWSLT